MCEFEWADEKAPPFISLDQHLLVIKCNYRTYDDNIGPKLHLLGI